MLRIMARAPSPPLPVIDHTGGHKRSQYHPQIGWEICQRICNGLTVREIAADPAMPSYATIFHWRKVHGDFAAMYDACRDKLARKRQLEAASWAAATAGWREAQIAAGWRRRRPAGSGRTSTFTMEAAMAVCERLAAGEALSAICRDRAMPSLKAVYTWLKRFPVFEAMYLVAREEQRMWLELKIEHVAGSCHWTQMDLAKAQVAGLQERLGRLTPKHYRPRGRAAPVKVGGEGPLFGDHGGRVARGHWLNGVDED